jgi:hypothetical protein
VASPWAAGLRVAASRQVSRAVSSALNKAEHVAIPDSSLPNMRIRRIA